MDLKLLGATEHQILTNSNRTLIYRIPDQQGLSLLRTGPSLEEEAITLLCFSVYRGRVASSGFSDGEKPGLFGPKMVSIGLQRGDGSDPQSVEWLR